jgi:ABC-2 type transport system permease protein
VLWYKAWLETRARFLTSLVIVTVISAFFVYHNQGDHPREWHREFYRLLFGHQQILATLWIFLVILLGMGGIVREKATGVSSFTLTLPVSKARLLGVRVGIGVIEAIVLAVVPWTAVYVICSITKMPISISQVGLYVLLLIGGGLVYFAMAVLVSSLVAGEYTAPAVAFGVALVATLLWEVYLQPFNNRKLLTGAYSVNTSTYLLSGHLPWLGIFASLSVAALMLLASVMIVQKREF